MYEQKCINQLKYIKSEPQQNFQKINYKIKLNHENNRKEVLLLAKF